ncbi:hypothetical protein [Cellulomonas sp. URHB0016]
MERDLYELMRVAADADEATLAHVGTEGPMGRALAGVRHRRRVRHSQQTVLGVAAVAALGVAVVLAGNLARPHVDPAVTPSPHVSTSPHPSTTPTATAVPSTPPVPLIEEPGLPPYRPLTADVLATAGAGWVVSELDLPGTDESDFVPAEGTAIFVSSPTGDVYRAAAPDPSAVGPRSKVAFTLERWPVGASYAVVSGLGEWQHRGRLDLLTGVVTEDDRGLPEQMQLVDVTPDGTEVWERSPGAFPLGGVWVVPASGEARQVGPGGENDDTDVLAVDPSGRYAAVSTGQGPGVLDLTSETLGAPMSVERPAGDQCGSGVWFSATRLLVNCVSLGEDQSVVETAVVVDVSGGDPVVVSTREYDDGEPYPANAVRVADGVFAAWAGEGRGWPGARCPGVVWFDGEGRATAPVPSAGDGSTSAIGAVDGFLYTGESECGSDAVTRSVTRHDPATGQATVLLTRPLTDPDGPGIGKVVVSR